VTDWAIELRGVSIIRARRTILRVPELCVPSGSLLGIVGPNGAGKTTLLRVCATLLLPDAGEVRVLGRDAARTSAWERSHIRRLIGCVPQTVEYMADLPFTVEDIVSMGLFGQKGLFRRLDAQDNRRVALWIERLGLSGLRGAAYRSLSGGEQRKILIARAMVQEPKLLLLDEPAANLDLDWKEQLVQLVEHLFKNFAPTVIMVSHETCQLPSSYERVALMKGGEIISVGPKRDALSSASLSLLYNCAVETVVRGNRYHSLTAKAKEKENASN